MSWVTINPSEIKEEQTRTGPHSGRLFKTIHRLVCKQCGLVRLKNDVSKKAWRRKCVY